MDESETFSNDDDLINPEVINTHVVYLVFYPHKPNAHKYQLMFSVSMSKAFRALCSLLVGV